MCAKVIILCLCATLSLFHFVGGAGTFVDVQTKLMTDLLQKYDSSILPVFNRSQPIPLSIGIQLLNLVELFEKDEVLETGSYLQQMWNDFRLKWDPSKYDGLHVIHIPIEKLWQPDLALYNNAEVSYSSMKTLAIVFSDGHVFYSPRARIRTRCEVDLTQFPFDTQTCSIKFGSYTYDGNTIHLKHFQSNTTLDLSEFTINKEWEVVRTSMVITSKVYPCCKDQPWQSLSYSLSLKRNPVYYTHVFILPAVLLALLVPFQFFLPPDSKERLVLGSMLLVGIILLISTLNDFLPPAHPNLPYLVQYYCLTMVWISISLACSVWVINTYDRGPKKKKVPGFIRSIFLKALKKIVCLGDDTYYPLDESETISLRGLDKSLVNSDTISKSQGNKLERDVEEILRHLHSLVIRSTVAEARFEVRSEWHQVAIVFDRILCFVFFLTFLIYSFVLLA